MRKLFFYLALILLSFSSCVEKIDKPIVSTMDVSVQCNRASSGGVVVDDCGAEVISRGVCWSTNQNPTLLDNYTVDSCGTGEFYSDMLFLFADTKYYVRAYATSSEGTSYGEQKSFVTLKDEDGTINGYEYVDLGLPSGVKWATCNVGAFSPEEYGYHYAWGESEPKEEYYADNCSTMDLYSAEISGDELYDVARKKWGSSWRMPTLEESEELFMLCECEYTTYNGVVGNKVTGPNGNHIFLPAAGYKIWDMHSLCGEKGCYWSGGSNYLGIFGCRMSFGSPGYIWLYDAYRYEGMTIRPVTN